MMCVSLRSTTRIIMLFSVSVLFSSSTPEQPPADCLWEEQLLLIVADSEEEAALRAESVARESEHEFETASGEMLSWKFAAVERTLLIAEELAELRDGFQLFWRFLRKSEAESLFTPFPD
jgi:hypothetical protein